LYPFLYIFCDFYINPARVYKKRPIADKGDEPFECKKIQR